MNKTDLMQIFNKFQRLPFPQNSTDDVLSAIHDELAEWDGYMAGLILNHSQGLENPQDEIAYDDTFDKKLRNRLEQSPELREEIDEYLRYLNEWKKIIEIAKEF